MPILCNVKFSGDFLRLAMILYGGYTGFFECIIISYCTVIHINWNSFLKWCSYILYNIYL